jgi:hypothetical protein
VTIRHARLPLALATAATLVSCSTGNGAPVTTDPAPASSSPTAGMLTVEQAGEMFTAAVDPVNAAIAAFNTLADGKTAADLDLPAARAAAGRIVTAGTRAMSVLVGARWPRDVATDMATLSREVSARVAVFRTAAAASTAAEFIADLDALPTKATGTAGLIRAKLGLPG